MGYTTEFVGHFTINPPLEPDVVTAINDFSQVRHEGDLDVGIDIWCDWEVSPDGTKIYWNGKEKSYDMEAWIVYLRRTFMEDRVLTGTVLAYGESAGDVWKMAFVDDLLHLYVLNVDGWELKK